MASTSSTNAATESRSTSVPDECGMDFFLGRWLFTLVAFGLRNGDDASSPGYAPAHAAGHP